MIGLLKTNQRSCQAYEIQMRPNVIGERGENPEANRAEQAGQREAAKVGSFFLSFYRLFLTSLGSNVCVHSYSGIQFNSVQLS